MELINIYTVQSYIDELIVEEKQENKDYEITVERMDDDGEMIAILVDGNHSLEAAKRDGVEPEIEVVESSHKSLEEYVESFGDLSNPVNIITGRDLW
jgi:hypothetical protein